jgi:hypothetical protein
VSDQRTRFGEQRWSANRRPGGVLGRRFAFVLAVVYFAFAGGVAAGAPTVVSATVYPSGGGSVTTATATLSGLNNCQQYPTQESGWSPITLYPSGQPYQPAAGASWELSTVLTCGMNVPLNNVTGVQVYSPRYGFDTMELTNAELTDASQFHDPAAPDALPLISNDEGQNTYVRPWLGGTDQNAKDQVVEDGAPVTIVVYENGAELTVLASASTVSKSSKHEQFRFSATVRTSSGSTVPTSALTWSWNFGYGGSPFSSPTPEHSFVHGRFPVTVQVTDHNTGAGGTDTIDVNAGNPGGNGNSPTGPNNSSGDHPGGSAGGPNDSATTGKTHSGKGTTTNGHSNQTTTTSTGGSGGTGTGTATGTGTTPAPVAPNPTPALPNPAPRSATHPPTRVDRPPAATGPLVTGRLISDVIPVPANDSPLVKVAQAPPATAPAIRPATTVSLVPALAAGFAVVLLLCLGAGKELRGRRNWRTLLFGS